MRPFFLLMLFWLATARILPADEQLLERFDGHNSLTTSDFKVPDRWEIRWHSAQSLSVGVIQLDNAVVAGGSGMNSGSLYLPKGGTFRLHVVGQDPIAWDVAVVALGPISAPPPDASPPANYVPTPGPEESISTNAAPNDTADETNAPPAPPPVPTQLTPEQEQAIVVVNGDRAQGAGFLLQTPVGLVVITTLDLISNNPHLDFRSKNGDEIKVAALQAATDRDLAMIGVEESSAKLEAATDVTGSVQPGDAVLTSANAAGAPASATTVHVLSIAPSRLNLSDFQDHGELGGPILQAKSGQVIAVTSAPPPPPPPADLEEVPFATREAALASSTPYFGLRLDTVPGWESCDWKRFSTETMFLDQFHQRSRFLDAYLNGKNNDNRPAAKIWQQDDKIKTANDNFVQDSSGGDPSQRLSSMRSLLFELGIAANADMDQIQQPANFYTYDQARARDEIAYRQALKAEIDNFTSNVKSFGLVTRRNNPPADPDGSTP